LVSGKEKLSIVVGTVR